MHTPRPPCHIEPNILYNIELSHNEEEENTDEVEPPFLFDNGSCKIYIYIYRHIHFE